MTFIEVTDLFTGYKMLVRADLICKVSEVELTDHGIVTCLDFNDEQYEYVSESLLKIKAQLKAVNK